MWVARRHSDGALGVVSVEQADGERVESVVERLRIGRHRELVGVGTVAQVHRRLVLQEDRVHRRGFRPDHTLLFNLDTQLDLLT